jgi:hypothetical protein
MRPGKKSGYVTAVVDEALLEGLPVFFKLGFIFRHDVLIAGKQNIL